MKHGHSGPRSRFEREDLGTRASSCSMIGSRDFWEVTYSSSLPYSYFSIITSVRAWPPQPAGHSEGSDVACGHAGGYG